MQVVLSWTAVPDALSYNIYRSQTSGSGYQLIFTTLTATSYTDGPGDLTNGVTYYYVVTAVNADGESPFSLQYTAVPVDGPGAPDVAGGQAYVPPSTPSVPQSIPIIPPFVAPPVIPPPEDLLDWWINSSLTTHVEGTPPVNPIYGYKDPDGKKFWLIKNAAGHPWDIEQYDSTTIYHWITENGDQPGNWDNGSAYKRFLTKVPLCPRYFTLGTVITLLTPGNNPIQRTINCGADAQANINIGNIKTVTYGPTTVNYLGDVGSQVSIIVEYYYGGVAGVYPVRERYYLVKGMGQVKWDVGSRQSDGTYTLTQISAFNLIRSGGPVAPSFPCSAQSFWTI